MNALTQTNDRRAPSVAPRKSWASPEPYVRRPSPVPSEPGSAWSSRGYVGATMLGDALIVSAVALLSVAGHGWREALVAATCGAMVFVVTVALQRGYDPAHLGSAAAEFQSALRASGMFGLVVVALDYFIGYGIPRREFIVGLVAIVALTWLDRFRRRHRLHRRRSRGESMQRTLLVGGGARASAMAEQLRAHTHQGLSPIGVCLVDLGDRSTAADLPVLGGAADIVQVAVDRGVSAVVVADGALGPEALRRLSWALGRVGVNLLIAPDLQDVAGPRLTLRDAGGVCLLEVEVGVPPTRRRLKGLMDRAIGAVALLVASPVIAGAALAVRATSPGGAFFRQERVGLDGSTFVMYKIRTMVADAEARKASLLEHNESGGVLFKMQRDPRVTPVGRVLRRFSIDELPQLWNVVRGDMSLVGPRPPLASEVAQYSDPVGRRLHVRPGLTGLWQVSGRSDLDWETSVALDLRYVDNWSLTMDVMILWKTARAVLGRSGAY